jgi:hypothetical protein
MKTCKCGCLYADDYNGSCSDCGRGMADASAGGLGSPENALQRQAALVKQEAQMAQQIGNHGHSNIRFKDSDPVFQAAKEMVLDFRTPEQRARDEHFGL